MLDTLTRRLSGVFAGLRRKGRLTEEDVNAALREVRVALLEADVNFQVAKLFVQNVKEKAVGEEVYSSLSADQTLVRIVRDELVGLLGEGETAFHWSPSPPTVILMAGLQGSGKTTTCAKLAKWLLRQGKKPMMAACDLQRPAAVTQLQVLGDQVGVPVFGPTEAGPGATPPEVAAKALERARHLFHDVLIVDTAGRLSIDEALMEELSRVSKAVKPSETLLVLDSTTGQEAVTVASDFHKRLTLSGVVFTKLDSDTRGGAVLSVRAATDVPVRFVGVGEQTEALEEFVPRRMAERILGMGDVLGIIEKAEQAMQGESLDMLDLQGRMKAGKMDFNDFLQQMRMLRKMGPLKSVMKLVPGLSAALPEGALDNFDERRIDQIQAIVLSMTPAERSNPELLNGSRRKRVARGSGTSQEEVNRLLEQLYEMRKGMKQFSKMDKRMKKLKRR
ncbi:MAG: signal recognition particle protein [Fimbriimonadaceae bacterium]|nr:signal recognition particle protein [Fimbriimonadaceae bacterium]QYK59383.1 MAG: signal recognition particle protein [Fimbriimonadaceae bacterium]